MVGAEVHKGDCFDIESRLDEIELFHVLEYGKGDHEEKGFKLDEVVRRWGLMVEIDEGKFLVGSK